MAYGTKEIPKVYKIFGPGNSWVTEAKAQCAGDHDGAVSDMPAGPSEVLVIADSSADPELVASDLLSQAEHGTDSQTVLVTPDKNLLTEVRNALKEQIKNLPRQEQIIGSLSHSLLIATENITEAVALSNSYGPEHLIIQTKNAEALAETITNAGSVFIGEWSPESAGDYASGTNHVLPTYGFTKAVSGLTTAAFTKQISFQNLTSEGLQNIGPAIECLATEEGLLGHKNAVTLRLRKLSKNSE